jgi:hypothetical protein
MATYYTVFLAQTNISSRERIALGMTMVDPETNTILTDYSLGKLDIVQQLAGDIAARNVRWFMESLLNKTEEARVVGIALTPEGRNTRTSVFRKEYLEYLHNLLGNLLVADPVREIDLPANEETFDLIYRLKVDPRGRDGGDQVKREV